MELLLERRKYVGETTLGALYADGRFECYTLEDQVRPDVEKVPGRTAIPTGRYRVTITMSNRFKKPLPLLHDVPNFTGIRIHSGNTAVDTEGCILVGTLFDEERRCVLYSRAAMAGLQPKIQAALLSGEEVWIEVKNLDA